MKITKDWKLVLKHWSTWILATITMLAGLQEYLPLLQEYLPKDTMTFLALLAIGCKFIDQNLKKDNHES